MSEIKQLPAKYKLFLKGEHVGYEDHFLNPAKTQIEIFHEDMDGKTGRILYGFYIPHDEKRQSTGFKDTNGEEIFFGDILSSPLVEGNFIVKMKNGVIIADNGELFYIIHRDFCNRELAK